MKGSLWGENREECAGGFCREGDRLVGVISHVAQLRESIDSQIIVRGSPSGSRLSMETVR